MFDAILLSMMLAATPPADAPRFEPADCPAAAQPLPRAKCGIVRVPEDRARPGGRSIALNIIVLTAASPARLPPLFDIDGGPGLPSTKNADFYAFTSISNGRDVVLVDQRGTGKSNPLECPELAATSPAERMLPPAAVERCRRDLSAKADLRFYGTADAIADLDAVRQALGYDKIDLSGLSYGTTVALRYMQRYPGKVRAAVLMGTAPPDAMPPRHHAPAAARAINLLLADCAADADCSQRFPRLADDLERARHRLAAERGPAAVEIFMERLRSRMYMPSIRAGLPLAIEKAANGDLSAIFPEAAGPTGPSIADGMFLAVTCTESFGLMDYEAAAREARTTGFGDYRLRRQRDACAQWPRGRIDHDHLQLPAAATAAVLLLSGEMDPVTPPEWSDRLAEALPGSRHIVIPRSGHIFDGMSDIETCLDPLLTAFLDHGDPAKIDATCVARMKAPAYLLQ